MRRGDQITDHPDQARMQEVIFQGANRIIAVDSQRRGDQIVGAQREEIDPV